MSYLTKRLRELAPGAVLIDIGGSGVCNAAADEIDDLRTVLKLTREKLVIYRAASDGEYRGGMEHMALLKAIDNILGQT